MSERSHRSPLSKALQVAVFRRDGWLCCWCKHPVIFAPVMRLLEREVRTAGNGSPLAYHHAHWTRDGAPLLDLLGAVIDHIEALSVGGTDEGENLATACNKCNGRKSAASLAKWGERPLERPVKGKYGEPQNWDGLSSLFVMFAQRDPSALTESEKGWFRVLFRNPPPIEGETKMADRRLLQIILEESEKSPTGAADGQAVAQRYGDGFHPAFIGLIQEGYIAEGGTVGTIRLSASGRNAAQRS